MANLYTADEWKGCLCGLVRETSAKPVFIVGAGLSWDGKVGVWGVSEIVEYVKTTFKDIPGIAAVSGVGSAAYQEILNTLKGNRRQTAVDKTIRHAILAAAKESDAKIRSKSEVDSNSELKACIALQSEPSAWNLPAGVGALADLIGLMEARAESTPGWQHPCVLSTNFDGLLEIALHQRGIKHRSEVIAGDQFPQGIAGQVSILHLHGYWLHAPTLHDPAALKTQRPSLEAALREYLRGAQVFVMGYAGWDDIVFRIATKVLNHQESERLPELIWAFHESKKKVEEDDCHPRSASGHVIASLDAPAAISQTHYYCGVDVHRDLPEVVGALTLPNAGVATAVEVKPTLSMGLVQLLEALVRVVPKRFVSDVQAILEDAKQSKPIGLVGVVALCCMVLEDAPKDVSLRMKFGEAAWDLIAFMVGGVVDPLRQQISGIAAKPGEVIRVPAKTHFMVALLLAKKTHARNLLLPGPKGAISRDDLSLATRSIPFEAGPAEPDRMFQFETLVWKAVFPSEPGYALGSRESPCVENPCVRAHCKRECNRQDLYDRLGADAEKGHPHFLMINPGSGTAWKDIAAKAKEIVFVEPDGSATTGIDEGRLAFLISDFLKLTSKENP